MIISERRLSRMIGRDPVAVVYGEGDGRVETTGLTFRARRGRAGSDREGPAGTIEDQRLRLLLRVSDCAANPPTEGLILTVGGVAYRADAPEVSSDGMAYDIPLNDPSA